MKPDCGSMSFLDLFFAVFIVLISHCRSPFVTLAFSFLESVGFLPLPVQIRIHYWDDSSMVGSKVLNLGDLGDLGGSGAECCSFSEGIMRVSLT